MIDETDFCGYNQLIMNIITIPKKLAQKGDLVVIPRKEYEALLNSQKIEEVAMTSREKKALLQARKNLAQGKFLTLHELKQKLGIKN